MKRLLIIGMVLAVALAGCRKEQDPDDIQPVAFFMVSPGSGNTTTIFKFDSDSAIRQGTQDNPVFVRWDWESDGTWDRMYSTGGLITHRFFKAGTYLVTMEASTLGRRRDSVSMTITVPQGYSPPRADFLVTPDSANILADFVFDASLSRDDEDSLDLLEFRWDFNGDLTWDTEFSGNPVISHQYKDDFHYPVRLEARDPQQMTSTKTKILIVNRLDDRIVPIFTHECWPCTIEDTVRFDAGGSYYQDQPDMRLRYSWDVRNDHIWEVTLDESPLFNTIIGLEGKTAVNLRVTNDRGMYMEFTDTVELFPFNSPPIVRLVVGNRIGNTGSRYYLHIRGSSDRDDSYMDLRSRWDVNNDGIWETQYDGLFEVYLTFPVPGEYPVTVMLTDPKDKSSLATDTVWVVEGNHETGILEDKRGDFIPQYYGTVKIGNRWWMQSNLAYQASSKDATWYMDYYNNDPAYGERYGGLYPHRAIAGKPAVCPTGWHVPSLEEWRQLMTDLGTDATIGRLMEGGSSEMHVLLAGGKDYAATRPGSKDKFSGMGTMANFWTSTVTPTGQAYEWYIDPGRQQNKAMVVGKNYWFSIRCIKED